MVNTTVVTAKSLSSGAISVALFSFFTDAETVFLIVTALFASTSSYFYDWVHTHPKSFGMKEFSELIKYCFYGMSVMFIIYFLGKNNTSEYIDLPPSAWGFVSALCAGSAIRIVELGSDIARKFIVKRAE